MKKTLHVYAHGLAKPELDGIDLYMLMKELLKKHEYCKKCVVSDTYNEIKIKPNKGGKK